MAKIGRNDPCPCGSGKKYKQCCGGVSSEALRFPPDFAPVDDGSGRTVMERQGRPNAATRVIHELKAELGDRTFGSAAELQAFLEQSVSRRRQAPIDDFLGLSPARMHRILHAGSAAMEGFVEIRGGIEVGDLASLPLLQEVQALLGYLQAEGAVKATAKGNLPRVLVLRWWNEIFAPREPDERIRDIARPNQEAGDWGLLTARKIAGKAGLLKLRQGRFSLTERGRRLAGKADLDTLYRELFEAAVWKYDWNEGRDDFRYLHPLSQDSFLFNLYVFRKLAVDWIDGQALVAAWLRAFPAVLAELGIENGTTCSPFLKITFEHGLVWMPLRLGLLEKRGGLLGPPDNLAPAEYRLSPVGSRLLEWRL